MNLRPFVAPDWVEPAIIAVLDPGESVEVFCDFHHPEDLSINRTLVLTNRNLRFLGFKPSWFSSKPRPLVSSFTIPLHTINGVGVNRDDGGWVSIAKVGLQVAWTGGAVEVWDSVFQAGDDLATKLEAALARRTAAAEGGGIADEIAKLGQLASEGVLSPEEFERGKELFLGRAPDEAADKIALLRQLHSLFAGDILSESEFNMKKWDILSS